MDLINCYHETEGFCQFDGFCEYKHELMTGETVCNEYCRQYINQYFRSSENLDEYEKDLIDLVNSYENH